MHNPLTPFDRALDRWAAIGAIAILQVVLLLLGPSLCVGIQVRGLSQEALIYLSNTLPAALSVQLGFWAAFAPGKWPVRGAAAIAGWGIIWAAYSLGEKLARGIPMHQDAMPFYLAFYEIEITLVVAGVFLLVRRFMGVTLQHGRALEDVTANRAQFHLRDLLIGVMFLCIAFAAVYWAGPVTFSTPGVSTYETLADLFGPSFTSQMLTISFTGAILLLVPFTRRWIVWLLVPLTILLAAALNTAWTLFFLFPTGKWTTYVGGFLWGSLCNNAELAAHCTVTMLAVRWLGYELRREPKSNTSQTS